MSASRHPLLQPRWIVAHVIILVVVVTFPLLGTWQLSRWQEESARQALLDARIDQAPVPVAEVLHPQMAPEEIAALEYRPVTATGTYLADQEVAQRNRSLNGRGGFGWLTPLLLEDGRAVLVRRGFVPPTQPSGTEPTVAPPPQGAVTVTGWLERSGRQPSGFGPRDPATGILEVVFHADVERLDRQVSADLLPMVLHLSSQSPPQTGRLPVPQPVPELGGEASESLGYAIQWFAFTAIAVIGYAVVLRTKRRGDEPAEDPPARTRAPTP